MARLDWFTPFQAAYNAYLWNSENGFAQSMKDEAAWQLEMCRVHSGSDRRCVWTWRRMMVRTRVVWQRDNARKGGV